MAVLAAVAMTLAACGTTTASSGRTGREPAALTAAASSNAAFVNPSGWGPTYSYNYFASNFPANFDDLVLLPLGVLQPPKMTHYIPELASSWRSRGRKFTITLQHAAKWQDGTPVTSKDVLTSLLLQGAAGTTTVWSAVTTITAPSPDRLVLDVRPGVAPAVVENDILPTIVLPSSVYGRFVTPGLERDLVTYSAEVTVNPTAAAKSPQEAAISAAYTKLSKFAPTSLVGDGPFKVASINSSEAKLVKSSTFFKASSERLRVFDVVNTTSNETVFSELLGGEMTFSDGGSPKNIVAKYLKTPGLHYLTPAGSGEYALVFNDHRYPFTLKAFRQAIAYLVNRPKVEALSEAGQDIPSDYPTGLTPALEKEYLTHSQLHSLNPYRYDPAKATKLLRAAGFKKSAGRWLEPNGKSLSLQFSTWAGYTDMVLGSEVITNELNTFGIHTTIASLPPSTLSSYLLDGKFDISVDFAGGYYDPLATFDATLASANFVNSSEPGIAFGPMEDVPGMGRVDVPKEISRQAGTIGPGPAMSKATWHWARFVDENLPYLTFLTRYGQVVYSSKDFTHWPGKSSPLWLVVQNNRFAGFLLLFEDGYVVPKG